MFKFKVVLTDGTKKILKSNDKQKILDYIKDNLLSIREIVQVREKTDSSINDLSEKDQIGLVQNKPSNIKFIDNPSEKVQLAAIKRENPYQISRLLKYIKNHDFKLFMWYRIIIGIIVIIVTLLK